MALLVVFSLLGAGCSQGEIQSNVPNLPQYNESSAATTAVPSHGIAYTYEEAGISANHEDQLQTLVYLKKLNVKDGKVYATVDPVRFIDCRKLASLHKSLPKDCANHPEVGFSIENSDVTTYTYEMTTSSGPFFLNRIDGEDIRQLRTMDLPTIQSLLSGAISPSSLSGEYYDAILHDDPLNNVPANLFYIIKKDGMIEKMVEKYRA